MVWKLFSSSTKQQHGDISIETGRPDSQTADSAEFGQSTFYGVKNYLHQFYASPTKEQQEGAWYLLPPTTSNKCALYFCRAASIFGLLLLVAGAFLLLFAYAWPQKSLSEALENVDADWGTDGNIYINRNDLQTLFEDRFYACKLSGLALFATGGLVLAMSLLIPTLFACCDRPGWSDHIHTGTDEPPVRVFATTDKSPASPTEKVKVQPHDKSLKNSPLAEEE